MLCQTRSYFLIKIVTYIQLQNRSETFARWRDEKCGKDDEERNNQILSEMKM